MRNTHKNSAQDFHLQERYSLEDVRQLIDFLRSPAGCPWDCVQTHQSLRRNLIEESFEAVEAIDRQDDENLAEELGDVLLQVFFHAGLAEDEGRFTLEDVTTHLGRKLYTRHSHVFGRDEVANDPERVLDVWEANKRKEKKLPEGAEIAPILQEMKAIPRSYPGLLRAYKLQKKAASQGFDWPEGEISGPLAKVKEEMQEVETATPEEREEELGDLLFAVVNVARHLKVDPVLALEAANRKFYQRFAIMLDLAQEQGLDFASLPLEKQDQLWAEAKTRLSSHN